MSEQMQARLEVLLDRIRKGLATCEDASEIEALLKGQIEQIEAGLPAEAQEDEA